MEIGFRILTSDPCVYIFLEGDIIVILTLYIGDVLLLRKDLKVFGRIKRKLMNGFTITDMRDV